MSLISAIIMASGFSRRMGENKLLMKYNNKFLIEYTLDVISKCNFKDKLIVTQYEKIKEIGENLDFKVVKNKYPNRGISESIKLGIKNCEESEGYMFFVGDQPLLDKKDIEKLINVFNEDTSFIVIPKYKNRFGNPVIYPKKYKEDILNGFDLLHIDPTKDPDEYCKVVDIDVVFNRTIELIEYCEQVRKEYGVLSISELVLNYLNRRQLN